MHEVQIICLGGLSLPRKSVVRVMDCPDLTMDVYLTVDIKQQHTTYMEFIFRYGM